MYSLSTLYCPVPLERPGLYLLYNPFAGQKVHRTFCIFRLTPSGPALRAVQFCSRQNCEPIILLRPERGALLIFECIDFDNLSWLSNFSAVLTTALSSTVLVSLMARPRTSCMWRSQGKRHVKCLFLFPARLSYTPQHQ